MVSFVGLSEIGLPGSEERHVRAIVQRHMQRVRALSDDIINSRIRIKRAMKRGGTSRYEVSVAMLTTEGPSYATSSSWTLATAIHSCFEAIENRLEARKDVQRHMGGHTEVWNYPNPVI